ncbi:MAG: EamA family transporter RarD [Mogibacterium sp.]|uniref:EamA family transporter RarD n=1 Tax=Mogibacterium sp. TaxID=2049035 RepID=UPI001A453FD5|nr:EamA family transporter RarD [Mogibacterium sp.]MBL6468067.1 EamA family transporter RarD [Mogibacterium sp.]
MTKEQSQYRKGILQVVFCMVIWGVLPIYWKSLIPISSSVIILYRVLMVLLTALLLARKNYTWKEIWAPLKEDRKTVRTLVIAGIIITINWSTYIWAVNAGFILQTSLGYYIEPLMVCLLGIILFRERVTKYKVIAMIFALAAVLVMLVHFHQIPTVALGLALTFSVYAAIKRSVTIDPVLSMIYETMFLAPIALAIILYQEISGKGAFAVGAPYQVVLLLLCGFCTAVPLMLFSAGAQKTSMFILGLVEYISPTMQMILGILLYHEHADSVQFMAFGIIWIGLVFFTVGEFRDTRPNA